MDEVRRLMAAGRSEQGSGGTLSDPAPALPAAAALGALRERMVTWLERTGWPDLWYPVPRADVELLVSVLGESSVLSPQSLVLDELFVRAARYVVEDASRVEGCECGGCPGWRELRDALVERLAGVAL